MPRRASRLTLQEAADELGVHYMTAYHYVRLGRLPATQSDGRWWVARTDLQKLRRPAPPKRGQRGKPNWGTHRHRLVDRLIAGDSGGGWAVVEDALRGGAEPSTIYVDLIGPVLHEIGDRWSRGEATVADEHRATAVTRRLVGRLSPRFNRPGRSRATVLLGGAAGDPHELPLAMLSDMLRGAGFEVIDLGANAPAASFVETAQKSPCVAIGISAATDDGRPSAAATIAALRTAGIHVPVLVGGPAFDAETALAIGADGFAADGRDAVTEIERVLGMQETS